VGALMNTQVAGTCGDFDITRSVSPPAPNNIYTVGATYTVTSTVSDGTNTATFTQQLKIVDDTLPTITAPPAVTVNADPTSCAVPKAGVPLGNATATAHCGVPTITNDAPSAFPLGNTTVTWTVTDTSGHTATATQVVTVVDHTPPTISCPANISTTVLSNTTDTTASVDPGTPTVQDNCYSNLTVTGTRSDGQPLTAPYPLGVTTITWQATDGAGNQSQQCQQTIQVSYIFTGFFSPVSNLPTLNQVNAGRAIPVKFSLSGNKGLNIFAAGYPLSGVIACNASAPVVDLTETVTAGGSSLGYTSSSDQYTYVWATSSSWAGTCRQLVIKLNDGTEHRANFKFR
jgi:hypothetical protein